MVMVNSHMLMVVFMKENGNLVRWKDTVNYIIQVKISHMKVSGKEMPLMEMEKFIMKNQVISKVNLILLILMNLMIIGIGLKESLLKILKKDLVHFTLLMVKSMLVNLNKIWLMDKVPSTD